jgi:hypothetical protein
VKIFGLEIAIEGVGEKDNGAANFTSPRLRGEVGALVRAG